MVYPAWPPGKENEETIRGPDQASPGSRPPEIGDEELRVEDIMAWLEGMDPLKPVRIVMQTRDFVVASAIHTITEEDETVDIFPVKMPNSQKDIRTLLSEKADPRVVKPTGIRKSVDGAAEEILDAIRRRKKARQDAGQQRERLTGAE